jgi:hypothetical protein
VALLQKVAELGSITAAARAMGISYKGAWEAIEALNNLSERPLVERSAGGSGGGGSGAYNSTYVYYQGLPPMSGGGGGGALTLETPETFTLTGVIEARGGDGGAKAGNAYTTNYYVYTAGAGGGAGGALLLRAGVFYIVYGMVDASGGKRSKYCYSSWEKYTNLSYVWGGQGGDGVIRFEGKSSLPAVSNVTVNLGSGRLSWNGYTPMNDSSSQMVPDTVGRGHVSGGFVAASDMGVSKWFDGGSVWTRYTKLEATSSPTGGATPYIEVANSLPATGEVDESDIDRYDATAVSNHQADGRRWWRFVWKLYPTTPNPAVDEGTLEGGYTAK